MCSTGVEIVAERILAERLRFCHTCAVGPRALIKNVGAYDDDHDLLKLLFSLIESISLVGSTATSEIRNVLLSGKLKNLRGRGCGGRLLTDLSDTSSIVVHFSVPILDLVSLGELRCSSSEGIEKYD